MTEPVTQFFERASDSPVRARGVESAWRRAGGIRRRRRWTAAVTAGCVVFGVLATSRLLAPAPWPTPVPAVSPTSAPAPAPGRSPDGTLHPADLGAGWQASPAAPGYTVGMPSCHGYTTVYGAGRTREYDGPAPQGADRRLSETTIRLEAGEVRRARQVLQDARTGCAGYPGGPVLALGDGVLVLGWLTPEGSVGRAEAYALTGDTLTEFDTHLLVLEQDGTYLPLPGRTPWVLATLATAVERATGSRPVLPAPDVPARLADARYVAPTGMRTPAPGPPAASALPPTGDNPPAPQDRTPPAVAAPTGAAAIAPEGFLSLGDLGPGGAWSVGTRPGDRRTGADTALVLPAAAGVPSLTVRGQGSVQLYRGWLGSPATEESGNSWLLRETVIRLDPATRFATAVDYGRTSYQPGPYTSPEFGQLERLWTAVTSFGATQPVSGRGNGSHGVTSAWALQGDVLIELDSLPGGPHGGGATTDDDVDWFSRLPDLALARAGA